MAEMALSLYELNKQMMTKQEPMSEHDLTKEIAEVASWFSYKKDQYFMLLCRELNDYTIFHFNSGSKPCYEASQELLEVLQSRGEIMDISYEKDVFPIWIRKEDDSFLYHLFPYDSGVIEV